MEIITNEEEFFGENFFVHLKFIKHIVISNSFFKFKESINDNYNLPIFYYMNYHTSDWHKLYNNHNYVCYFKNDYYGLKLIYNLTKKEWLINDDELSGLIRV